VSDSVDTSDGVRPSLADAPDAVDFGVWAKNDAQLVEEALRQPTMRIVDPRKGESNEDWRARADRELAHLQRVLRTVQNAILDAEKRQRERTA